MPSHNRFLILFAFIIVAIGWSENAEANVISQCNSFDRSCVCERSVLPCTPDCFWHPSDPRCGLTPRANVAVAMLNRGRYRPTHLGILVIPCRYIPEFTEPKSKVNSSVTPSKRLAA